MDTQDYMHPLRNGLLMLLFGSAFILYSAFGRTFREFGFKLPYKLWATLPSRIITFLLGITFLFGAVDQLVHVH
jgi:hypothetical protein